MDVSFTGLKNMSAIECRNPTEECKMFFRFVMELTNKGNKDLDEFKSILERFPYKNKRNILTVDLLVKSDEVNCKVPKYLMQVNSKELEMNDKNLPVFQKIAKILASISKNNSKNIQIDKSYITRNEYLSNIFGDIKTANSLKNSAPFYFIHNTNNIKDKAQKICGLMDLMVRRYINK